MEPSVPQTVALGAMVELNQGKIHVRVHQFGKKWRTMIEGLDSDLDQHKIARAMKKTLHCAASVMTDAKTSNESIKLQGDKREFVREWLVTNEVLTEREGRERIVIHGV